MVNEVDMMSVGASDKAKELSYINAIEEADPYRGRGTIYLHGNIKHEYDNDESHKSHNNHNPTGALVVPICLSTTFQQSSPGQPNARDDPNSFGMGYEYSRTGNPTRGAFERAMAAAEKARYCVAFSSGSAATSAVIHLLSSSAALSTKQTIAPTRSRVVCIDDVYGGTQRYFRKIVHPTMGIDIDFIDFNDVSLLKKKIMNDDNDGNNENKVETKLLWLETPTNPTLKITDIKAVSELVHKEHQNNDDDNNMNNNHKCLLAVDNTFCSPYNQSPLELGADIVVHSVTKYINGHSDVVMGVVCTNDEELYTKLRFIQNGVGAVPSPFDCYLAHRGLKTLHVRMEAAARNAMAIALFLEQHDRVAKVLYPGLPSHPQHELAKKQQHGFGAMITFHCHPICTDTSTYTDTHTDTDTDTKKQKSASMIILQSLKIFALAESLGAIESLAECPALMTHASVPDEQRVLLGIDETLIRLSVGIECCSDLVHDLDYALNMVSLSSSLK